MSLCVNFFFINKLNSQKTPFFNYNPAFYKKKNAFYCKSHEIKKKSEKKKIAIDKML